MQVAFDNKGRLWVATMASYPDTIGLVTLLPTDKLIIFEDTNKDGKADKQTNFADDLHIPIGFEIAHDGVYVSVVVLFSFRTRMEMINTTRKKFYCPALMIMILTMPSPLLRQILPEPL